jgi:DNA polymerase-3 subunit delta'
MDTVGHKTEKEILMKLARNGTIPHAFLFSGPKRIGKKSVALEFIKHISCSNKGEGWKSCNACYNCRNIDGNTFPDLVMVVPEDDSKDIKIEQMRDLQERFSLTSFGGGYKVAIIDDAHLMNTHTQNSFLKMLEEPRGRTIMILVTDKPDTLLPTIRSRVQELRFSILPKGEIEKYLISLGAPEEEAREISAISSGQIGKAVEYYTDKEKKKHFDDSIKELQEMMRSNLGKRFAYSKEKSDDLESLLEMLEIWERYFRKEMIIKVIKPSAEGKTVRELKEIVKKIDRSRDLLENTNSSKRLVLDSLMAEL